MVGRCGVHHQMWPGGGGRAQYLMSLIGSCCLQMAEVPQPWQMVRSLVSNPRPARVNTGGLTQCAAYWRPATSQFPYHPSTSSVSTAAVSNGSVLAPPVEISPQRRRRSSATFVPPSLHSAVQRKHQSDLGAAPRTPIAPSVARPGILRMPSQQAEKDAVDMLLFLNSPNNSGRFPATSTESHLRSGPAQAEAPSRRVMFENPISKNQPPDAQRGYSNMRNPGMHPKDTPRR